MAQLIPMAVVFPTLLAPTLVEPLENAFTTHLLRQIAGKHLDQRHASYPNPISKGTDGGQNSGHGRGLLSLGMTLVIQSQA